jgi:hypothetical protein
MSFLAAGEGNSREGLRAITLSPTGLASGAYRATAALFVAVFCIEVCLAQMMELTDGMSRFAPYPLTILLWHFACQLTGEPSKIAVMFESLSA